MFLTKLYNIELLFLLKRKYVNRINSNFQNILLKHDTNLTIKDSNKNIVFFCE